MLSLKNGIRTCGKFALVIMTGYAALAQTTEPPKPKRVITAKVVALEQMIYLNRLGAALPNGMIYALKSDVVPKSAQNGPSCAELPASACTPGNVQLRPDKRPRPMVLRANVGDLLQIEFTNYLSPTSGTCPAATPPPPPIGETCTRSAGVHVAGLELYGGIASDASYAGANPNSLVAPGGPPVTYKYYARAEGNFLLYSFDDGNGNAGQFDSGMFGSVNVQPESAEWYRSQVTNQDLRNATFNKYSLPSNMHLGPPPADQKTATVEGVLHDLCLLTTDQPGIADRDTVTNALVYVALPAGAPPGSGCQQGPAPANLKPGDGDIYTLSGHPVVNYDALDAKGKPILSMLKPVHVFSCDEKPHGAKVSKDTTPCGQGEIVQTDLTAIITGPYADRFDYSTNGPSFRNVPATPDRRQPYREFSIFYHFSSEVVQPAPFDAFFKNPGGSTPLGNTLANGDDQFFINYGSGGIGGEILANRLGVGPEKDCVECKFEEFFLSSWVVGDPAMVVDNPAKPTFAKFADDPSNVYHSYIRDHVIFRIFNASASQQHVHHQHAHQWLHTQNEDSSTYLDSQLIVPGAAYSLNMVYNGSGNRNGTIGDSIFHCHFYPHFAAGMWSLWRVHDVFEEGTVLTRPNGPPQMCNASDPACWNRALPDGELTAGSPVPALVPLPTIGMAPKPAKVKLVENGKRVYVQPENAPQAPNLLAGTYKYEKPQGGVSYKNPGYPFFVPGYGGHRPPHPPLDFASQPDKNGNKVVLDGGLPRHILLGGQFVREFHTIYDFSKDFSVPPQPGVNKNEVLGTMIAEQLPENGTPVEIAAMQSQSRRTVSTYSPDGLPGNFTLNGLPPISGAPFARPEVDDNGNVVSNVRRYQAAVIQRDVVLNKDGWHYPQQRMLTLWKDVNPTMSGERPPEPLFFRINTGETVEFWHTNLVPSYYDLDNFQVRTPTDIIGQHIHLVKFDVLASDGAANGFNYEDGTFSPDEVRERIKVINNTGTAGNQGMMPFSAACWDAPTALLPCLSASKRTQLKVKTVDDSNYPFKAPAGVDWSGAQTTIQRWDTDPLLNNQGRDRTMRTVFTHDHFGPSTHQNVGLYAGLVIEPDDSTWHDAQTGERMYTRSDGGPTSWQAIIKTSNDADSYREFMLEYQDSQLAYLPNSISAEVPPTKLNPIFQTDADYSSALGNPQCFAPPPPAGYGPACQKFRANMSANGVTLSTKAKISGSAPTWVITDHFGTSGEPGDQYTLTNQPPPPATPTSQTVAINTMPAAWIDPTLTTALNTRTPAQSGTNLQPGVNIIDGVGVPPGTYSVNYRSEPLPLRVTDPQSGGQATGPAGDLSYAFASGITRLDTHVNTQPDNGGIIPGSPAPSFHFPQCPLIPTVGAGSASCQPNPSASCTGGAAGGCVQPTDPYTPMLRAFQGDRIQIRTLVGAHVVPHPLMVRGVKWLFEPSVANSGYRDSQDTGLSEHYELLFNLPFSGTDPATGGADYLYQPSSGLKGNTNGIWGLMRAYSPNLKPVGLEKLPAAAVPSSTVAPAACPAEAPIKTFNVVTIPATQLPGGQLNYNSRNDAAGNFSPITDPGGLLYVLDSASCSPGASCPNNISGNLAKVKSGVVGAEPLMMRVNAGDCIKVNLTNQLGTVSNPTNIMQPWNPRNGGAALPAKKLNPSSSIGLSPQLVSYDVTKNAAFNVGFNPDQVIANGTGSQTYTWYAGDLIVRNGQTIGEPIEFGTVNLMSSDPLMQDQYGLMGALIVEPKDSTWTIDGGSQASANVTRKITTADGGSREESFREFILVAQDDNGQGTGYNYRSEPLNNRISAYNNSILVDYTNGFSNSVVGNTDPQTPVLWAPANVPVRLRVSRPGQDDDLVFTVHGHLWQEEPYTNASRAMGPNPYSNWLGTQQMGANDKFDLLIGKAGGSFEVPGDYMYDMINNVTNGNGMFGILRATADAITITSTKISGSELNISGSVSAPVGGGASATSVTISTVSDLTPSIASCTNTSTNAFMRPCIQTIGTAAVINGKWSFSGPLPANYVAGMAIRVQSNLPMGGQSTMNPE
ncbi:MAG TPA: hypothetical protein VKU19_36445 [Bryobacteraceae bacterium]|nr:hypothetical protein [Bryobacteraceae bacterium]